MLMFRLKRKIACKIHDEHYRVKDMAPPTESVAKMVAKSSLSRKQGKELNCTNTTFYIYNTGQEFNKSI